MTWRWPASSLGAGGGAVAKVAALQPLDSSVVAAWALQRFAGPPAAVSGGDRSGNGNNLQATGGFNAPDLIPGQLCFMPGGFGTNTVWHGMQSSAPIAALNLVGEMTLAMRIWLPNYGGGSLGQGYLYEYANRGDGSANGNITCSLYCASVETGRLTYFAQNGTHNLIAQDSSALLMTPGAWNVVSLRRTLAGAITFGANKTYETYALAAPSGGSNGFPCIGQIVQPSPTESPGVFIADVAVRNVRVSDAVMDQWTDIMLGT